MEQQGIQRHFELIEALQRYADLFTFAPAGCIVVGEENRVEEINRAAAELLGWPRSWVVGQLFSRWIVKRDLKRFLDFVSNACSSGQPLSDDFRLRDRRGRIREVRFDAVAAMDRHGESAPGRVRCQIVMTGTERRIGRREGFADMTHLARLNSCGEMAAALTHELTQPLGAITLYCKTTMNGLRNGNLDTSSAAATLERISEAAAHANATIRSLRTFLGKCDPATETLALNDVLREGVRLASAYSRNRASHIDMHLGEDLPPVRANRVHVQQVLLNLLQNGIDAMRDMPADRRRVQVTSERARPGLVLVTVTDAGPGMTAEQRRKAFEPFFTTKENGMGMGLSISRSIIESYGGKLWARAQRRGGALSFTLPTEEHIN